MFSSIFDPLASRTSLSLCFSTNSFSFSFNSPSRLLPLKMLTLSFVVPSALFPSLLYSPKMQTSRTAVPQKEQGGEKGQQPVD